MGRKQKIIGTNVLGGDRAQAGGSPTPQMGPRKENLRTGTGLKPASPTWDG